MIERLLVSEAEWLYRRGYSTPEKKYMNPDGTATSRVFALRDSDHGELSASVKSLTTPDIAIVDRLKYFLFEIHNKRVEEIGLKTFFDPLPDGTNDAHAVITGMEVGDDILPGLLARKSKRVFL